MGNFRDIHPPVVLTSQDNLRGLTQNDAQYVSEQALGYFPLKAFPLRLSTVYLKAYEWQMIARIQRDLIGAFLIYHAHIFFFFPKKYLK
jgi:hypothetical protein